MKKFIVVLSLVSMFLLTGNQIYAQTPPPVHNEFGNQKGGGAPIGGGLFILLGLSAAYGANKLRSNRAEKE